MSGYATPATTAGHRRGIQLKTDRQVTRIVNNVALAACSDIRRLGKAGYDFINQIKNLDEYQCVPLSGAPSLVVSSTILLSTLFTLLLQYL